MRSLTSKTNQTPPKAVSWRARFLVLFDVTPFHTDVLAVSGSYRQLSIRTSSSLKDKMFLFKHGLPALVGLSSFLFSLVVAQDGGILQPVLPSDLQQCSNVTLSWSPTPQVAGSDQQYAVRIIDSRTAGLELAAEVPLTWLGHFMDETSYSW